MKQESQAIQGGKPLHPVVWGAAIALIVFSAVGVSAVMGWIPASMGGGETAAVPTQAKTAVVHPRPAAQPAPTTRIAVQCAECGVVESVREVETRGEGSGLGAVGGAVVGGVLGNQVGGGRGQDVMTVVGAVGGALAGNEVEKRVKSTKTYSVTVRFDDGTTRSISEASATRWRPGDKVRVVNGAIQANA